MTPEQIAEVRAFLRSKGLSDDAIDRAVNSISFHEVSDLLRGTIDEAYEIGTEDLNTGPDTTENINEVVDEEDQDKTHPVDTIRDSRAENGEWLYDPKTYERVRYTGDWQPGVKFPAGAVEKGLVDPGLEYYEATGRQPETPIEKYYVREHMKRLKPEEKEHADVLGQMREEDIRDSGDVMFGVDLETQGLQGNVDPMMSREFLERYREPIVLGPNPVITPGKYDDEPYPTTAEMKRYIDEQCNKNVSNDEDKKDPGDYYTYSNILKRMDDTHTRKNSDYGDAAYKGYKKFGDYYFMVQLHNKYQRLESLTIGNKSQQVNDESIDDTLLDMANYAVMYLESRHRND